MRARARARSPRPARFFNRASRAGPKSVLLRLMLARTHLWEAMNESEPGTGPGHRGGVASRGRGLLGAVRLAVRNLGSDIGSWLSSTSGATMTSRARSRKRAARPSLRLTTPPSRSDLSWVLANAGRCGRGHRVGSLCPGARSERSLEILREPRVGVFRRRAANETGWTRLGQGESEFPILSAALHIRLGEVDEARALVARYGRCRRRRDRPARGHRSVDRTDRNRLHGSVASGRDARKVSGHRCERSRLATNAGPVGNASFGSCPAADEGRGCRRTSIPTKSPSPKPLLRGFFAAELPGLGQPVTDGQSDIRRAMVRPKAKPCPHCAERIAAFSARRPDRSKRLQDGYIRC